VITDIQQKIEELLEKDCYIIDFLPRQVKADSEGSYFEIEEELLEHDELHLKERFSNIIIKLLCYYSWQTEGYDCVSSLIRKLRKLKRTERISILLEDRSLIVVDGDNLYLEIYHPDQEMGILLNSLAQSEGLFYRKAAE